MVKLTDKEQIVKLQRRVWFADAGYNVDVLELQHLEYVTALKDAEVAQSIITAYEQSDKTKWTDDVIEQLNCRFSFVYASRGSDYLRCKTCGLEIEQYRGRPSLTNYKPPSCNVVHNAE
jgi:hypothetical protein